MPIVEVNGQELEFPDDMAPEAIKGVLQQKFPAPQSLGQKLERDAMTAFKGSMNPKATIFDTAANYGDFIGNAAGDVLGSAAGPEAVAAVDSAKQWLGNTMLGRGMAKVAENTPEAVSVPMRIVAPALAVQGAKDLATSGYKLAKGASGALGEAGGGIPTALPEKPSFNPMAAQQAIVDSYGQARQASGKLYDVVDSLAKGKKVDTANLSQGISGLIEDVKADPFHEAKTAVTKLQALKKKLDVGEFDLSDAVDLKKTLNASFKSNRFTQNARGTVYGQVGDDLGGIISKAAQEYPDFGAANELANNYWLNSVEMPFQNNPVMAKFFKPEDYYGYKSVEAGRALDLPDATIQRAGKTVSNIKTAADLNAIRRALPEDVAQQLSKEVIKAQGNTGRLQAAGKAAMGIADLRPHGIARTVGNIADVIAGVKLSPQAKELIAAAKGPKPKLPTVVELSKLPPNQAFAVVKALGAK